MGLPKNRRLRRPPEFRRVLRYGKRARNRLFSIAAVAADTRDGDTRFGFAVSKRVGNAVVRNRVKRRLRSIAIGSMPSHGWDLVITAQPEASHATYDQLASSIHRLVQRLRLDATDEDQSRRTRAEKSN